MKKVVYTAIFGGKDEIQKIDKSEGIDYILFTDDPKLKSNDFKIILCPLVYEDPVRNAKYFKILPHIVLPEYNYSLWIDANISIKDVDINVLFNNYLEKFNIALHRHPVRNCIYEEADICIQINKDNPSVIRKQMEKYRSLDYPPNNGLASCSIIYRRHTPGITLLNDAWWKEIINYSRRDQLSFNYVVNNWGHGYMVLNGHIRNNDIDGFRIQRHKLPEFINW